MTFLWSRASDWLQRAGTRLAGLSDTVDARLLALTLVVGTLSGLGAVLLSKLIQFVHWVSFDRAPALSDAIGDRTVLVLPAIGGLIVAPLVFFVAAEARGHGVPEVVLAVETRRGRIRPRVAAVKAIASAVTIGTGGSAGREGPIVQIGAALGSVLGQALRLSEDQVRLLLAAGAAGGIAATFNAPIAGMFFAVEVILRRYSTRNFTAIIIAAVMASVVYSSILGDRAVVQVPQYRMNHASEIGLYTLLGIVAAVVGMSFVAVLYALEDGFERLPLHNLVKPGLGGLAVGAIGLWSLSPLGAGTDAIERIVTGEYAARTLVLLVVAKIAATSFTLGSGGSGGVFAPSLFMGAAVGGAFGAAAHSLFPGVAEQPEAYGVVGMAAVFAAAARAPVTAVLIIFEMTRDYRLILPLMAAVAVATIAAQIISRETIYTIKLIRRGVDIQRERTSYLLDAVSLHEIMRPVEPVRPDMTVDELSSWFADRNAQAASVSDESGQMLGIVTPRNIEARLSAGDTAATARDIAHKDFPSMGPEATAHEALTRPETAEAESIVLVSRGMPRRVLGTVTRSDILRQYARLSRRPDEAARRAAIASLLHSEDTSVVSHVVERGGRLNGVLLRETAFPDHCVVVSIRREGKTLIPRGDVRLQAGDLVVVLAVGTGEPVRAILEGSAATDGTGQSPSAPP